MKIPQLPIFTIQLGMNVLTNQQIDSLLFISENPSNISVDSRVLREVLKFLKQEEYITIKGADGNDYFHYMLTEKGRGVV